MPVTKKVVSLPAEFVQSLSNYLSRRPYVEVADAMAILLTTPVQTIITPDPEPAKEPAPAPEPAKPAEPAAPVAEPAPKS